jgi:hypothetical protein
MLENLRCCFQFRSKTAALDDTCLYVLIELLCQDSSMSCYTKSWLACNLKRDLTASGCLLGTTFTFIYTIIWYIIYLLTAIGCHPVAVHIYTQTIHRTTQITTEQHKQQLMCKSARHAASLRVLPWHLITLIIIFMNCSWVVTRWQWSFYIVW